MFTHLRFLALGGTCTILACWSGAAAPDDTPPAAAAAQPVSQGQPSLGEVPRSVPNADPRIVESLSIETTRLHGFSAKDVEKVSTERLAAFLGPEAISAAVAAHPATAGYGDYVIDAGDELEFVSFDEATLSREAVIVRYDGYISLPRVSDLKVSGLTRAAAEDLIRKAYGAIYKDPEVSLAVTKTVSKSYVVTGDVATPGRYPYARETSLWDAINLAGGLRMRSSGTNSGGFVGITGQITKAFVIRRIDGERKVLPFDLRGLGKPGDYQGDTPVYYGDVVYVPEGVNLVYLLGESRSPVIVELTEGMTLLQMLALSGGFDASTAKLSSIILLRDTGENTTDLHRVDLREILKGKQPDLPLQPGDTVYIPRKGLLRLQEFVARFTGSISPILGLYTQAVDAAYALSLNRETLNALEDSNNVSVGTRASVPQGITRLPRIIGGATTKP
jgi:protein involved in polysaccharide export with SLBB domain